MRTRLEWDTRLDTEPLPVTVIQKWTSTDTQDTVCLIDVLDILIISISGWARTNHSAQSVAWSAQLTCELSGDNEPQISFAGNSLSVLVI